VLAAKTFAFACVLPAICEFVRDLNVLPANFATLTPPPHGRAILFAVTEFLGTGSQVPLLLVIDAI
jgi:hypothetical protein